MRLKGDILQITRKRDNKYADIALQVDQIEYITHKKDGKYYQPFSYVDDLDNPLILTGDCLERTKNTHLDEGESEFLVYDKKEDGEYELNPDKYLSILTVHDYDSDLTIVTSVHYTVTISNEEFKEIKTTREKAKKDKKPVKKGKKK